MQNAEIDFIVEPKIINEIFNDFKHKSPFNLEKIIKDYIKQYKIQDETQFFVLLSQELKSAYKHISNRHYIYHSHSFYSVVIIKYRMSDFTQNKGKSSGFRVVALVDEINKLFYLLDLYKHSDGKDNLTPDEKTKLKELCDEYTEIYKDNLC